MIYAFYFKYNVRSYREERQREENESERERWEEGKDMNGKEPQRRTRESIQVDDITPAHVHTKGWALKSEGKWHRLPLLLINLSEK